MLMLSERLLVCYNLTQLWHPPLQALFTRGHYTAAEARQQMMCGAGNIVGLDPQQTVLPTGTGSTVWRWSSWLEAVLEVRPHAQAIQ